MSSQNDKIISHIYSHKESFKSVYPWFLMLRDKGLNPKVITMDGERSVMRAIHMVWPKTTIQRCLYHIQREGMRWLRTFPKTQAGRDLRRLLSGLCNIKSVKERGAFVENYRNWLVRYKDFVKSLPSINIAYKDLKRTMVLIKNALPDMFHYLHDPNIDHTTNGLESFYSRLKADYRRHRGLTQRHKVQYLGWYCYFKNSTTN